jgi:phosphate transport system ATP-binding protein
MTDLMPGASDPQLGLRPNEAAMVRDEAADVHGAVTPRRGSSLVADSVSAWFGSHKVLERISLAMRANEVTALIGPSGCGKSTFLRILNRMHELVPSAALSGQVLLDGTDIYGSQLRVTETRLKIGMVFQKPNPFPTMTISENVLSGLKLSGTKAVGDRKALIESSLRRAGLWEEVKTRLDALGGALSGGQQQRLCIARTIAVNPEVILMDEPCSALDPIATARIEDLIDELRASYAIVIVTHSMQQAARVSKRTAFFHLGDLIEVGETDRVFTNPRHKLTEDYITGRFG